jgi:hypothetical protein
MTQISPPDIKIIENELTWLDTVIHIRLNAYFNPSESKGSEVPSPPDLSDGDGYYASLAKRHDFQTNERIVVAIALAAHFAPQMLDVFFMKNSNYDRPFTEFGGVRGKSHVGFIPTGETACFLVGAVNDLKKRLEVLQMFSERHPFRTANIIHFADIEEQEPIFSRPLSLGREFLNSIMGSNNLHDSPSGESMTTLLSWQDAVYASVTASALHDLITWVTNSHVINDYIQKVSTDLGYRALFFGPRGTGKKLAAALIGKGSGVNVTRVSISSFMSKYINETEKNLTRILEAAVQKNSILLFDEADTLFDEHEVANFNLCEMVLHKMNAYPGLVIMTVESIEHINPAHRKKFQSQIAFPKPDAEQRLKLWQTLFNGPLSVAVDFTLIAQEFEVTGGDIVNILRHCAILAVKKGNTAITTDEIALSIRKTMQ